MKTEKIFLIANRIYYPEKKSYSIGGEQTYVNNLAELCAGLGYDTTVVEEYDREFEDTFNGYKIVGKVLKKQPFASKFQKVYDSIIKKYGDSCIVILTSNQLDVRARHKRTVAIQHGIAFDGMSPINPKESVLLQKCCAVFKKTLRSVFNVIRTNYCKKIVMVDYNYYNWFSTIGDTASDKSFYPIPNYSEIKFSKERLESKLASWDCTYKIVFARRFVAYRGTEIFLTAAERLLEECDNVKIVFAGSGPLIDKVKAFAQKNAGRVQILSYAPTESIDFHSKFDIAVVPTLSAEGTSLSLLEAMSAGCFPVASFVGGLSNILINDYNGKLIYPSQDSLYKALKEAVTMPRAEFERYVRTSYDTVSRGFSKDLWDRRWTELLKSI